MKKQVFYIHGGEAFSHYEAFLENLRTREIRNLPNTEPMKKWTVSLVEDLGEAYEVFTPQMPNALNAKYEEWKIWFERHFAYIHDEVILLGWSLGAMFFVRYLTDHDVPFRVKHLFLLAGAYENIVESDSVEDGGDFFTNPAQISTLQGKVSGITIMHSRDDFVVLYEHALKYQAALPEAKLVTFEDKNHFLVPELPELVEAIKALG